MQELKEGNDKFIIDEEKGMPDNDKNQKKSKFRKLSDPNEMLFEKSGPSDEEGNGNQRD